MTRRFNEDEVRMTRAHAQRLCGNRGRDVVEVVRDFVGVQAQNMSATRMALRPRTTNVDDEVRAAYNEDRALVRIWAMRGTLHMVAAEDVGWLVRMFGPVFAAADQRRRHQLGLDDALLNKAIPVLRDIVTEHGPITRADLIGRLMRKGIRLDLKTQGPAHLIGYAAMSGVICRGPDADKEEPTYVIIEHWAGQQRDLEEDEALAELARRYASSRGPVTVADFKRWTGLPAKLARHGFELATEDLIEVEAAGARAWIAKGSVRRTPRGVPWVELIARFDEYLLSYASRDLLLPPRFAKRIQAGGLIKAAVLLDGRVVGTWKIARKKSTITVEIDPFETLTAVESQLESAVADIGRFFGHACELQLAKPS